MLLNFFFSILIVYTFRNNSELKFLQIQDQFKYEHVISELASSLEILAQQNPEKLLLLYKRSFLTQQSIATFCLDAKNPLAQYCAVLPKYRNNTKLNNNFNDFEMTLVLMSTTQQPQTQNEQQHLFDIDFYKRGYFGRHIIMPMQPYQSVPQPQGVKKFKCFTLKSQNAGFGIKYTLRYVDIIGVELRECYHPEQRVNSNPIWIAGQSYQQSIYN